MSLTKFKINWTTKNLTRNPTYAILLAALTISLILGTPRVMFMVATPAKWKVFRVICVAGSPTLCAPNAPTAVPGCRNIHKKGV